MYKTFDRAFDAEAYPLLRRHHAHLKDIDWAHVHAGAFAFAAVGVDDGYQKARRVLEVLRGAALDRGLLFSHAVIVRYGGALRLVNAVSVCCGISQPRLRKLFFFEKHGSKRKIERCLYRSKRV